MAAKLDRMQAKVQRDLFVPIAFTLAIKLEQATWAELAEDPGFAAFTLRSTLKLFKADGVVSWFDGWLEAEAAGAKVARDDLGGVAGVPAAPKALPEAKDFLAAVPVARVLDLTRRLCAETKDDAMVLGTLTGPLSLAKRLAGKGTKAAEAVRAAAPLSLALAKEYCEAGVSALLLAEEEAVKSAEALKPLDALFNLAAYYGTPVILLARTPVDASARRDIAALGVRLIAAPGGGDKAHVVPADRLDDPAGAKAWVGAQPGARGTRLFLTEWDIAPETPPEAVMAWQAAIAGT
jgi:hypothetical protein